MKTSKRSFNFVTTVQTAVFLLLLSIQASAQSFPNIANTYYRYDATDISSITKDADNNVTQLNDLSGNGLNLNQGPGVLYNPAGYIELTPGRSLFAPVSIPQPYS